MESNDLTRRELLHGLASTAALAGMSRLGLPLVRDEEPVGYAILGLGGYATNYILPNFAHCKLSKPVALISGTPSKLQTFGDKYNIKPTSRYTYDQMDAIKDNPEIEVVYIITPPGTHRDFTVRAAKLGKHVACEKPMAASVAECQEMIDACAKAGKQLQIGYRCHYEPYNIEAMKICRSGVLGTIRSIQTSMGFSMQPGAWRLNKKLAGGGSIYDIGIYGLQALRYLSGEEPTEVYATMHNPPGDPRFKEVEDTVHFTLKFPSGLGAHGTSSYSWTGANEYTVMGTRGRLTADSATNYDGHRFTLRGAPMQVAPGNQWAAQMDHLSESIRKKAKTNRTPGEMGLQDIRIIEAIYESARTGKTVQMKGFKQ